MRVVTAGAAELTLDQRHVCRPQHCRALVLMALEARVHHVALSQLVPRRKLAHHGMAIGARNIAIFVRAALPISPVAILVTAEANAVAVGNRGSGVGMTERPDA